jgi:hypothetical protein
MEAKIEEDVKLKYPGIKIEHPSLTADKKHKFLAGSPDGIANLTNENFLLEYKAPYSLFQSGKAASEANFLSQSADPQLSKRHNYFYQIQGLLHIFNLQYCLLVVAGAEDFAYIKVMREEDFFREKMFDKLRNFYFGAILPEIVFPMKRRGGLRKSLVCLK